MNSILGQVQMLVVSDLLLSCQGSCNCEVAQLPFQHESLNVKFFERKWLLLLITSSLKTEKLEDSMKHLVVRCHEAKSLVSKNQITSLKKEIRKCFAFKQIFCHFG